MAWALANRNGYASCHGGQKEYTLADGSHFVASVYGLSGSGKSTLTHAKHGGKYDAFGGIKVLHDDAFIINTDTCASIALEPTYFDKTADYPTGCPDNEYLLSAQNCSATLDENGKVQLVTEDVRNGNGRAIKSKLWSPNRVDKIDALDYERPDHPAGNQIKRRCSGICYGCNPCNKDLYRRACCSRYRP